MSKKLNKTFYRILLIVSFLILNALVLYGISTVLAFLNTGADRSGLLKAEQLRNRPYQPKITWDYTAVKGRSLHPEAIRAIEDDYLKAWYVKQRALQSNEEEGIADYFTDSARVKLRKIIRENKKKQIHLVSTSLSHQPRVEFFSENGQLLVFTDQAVSEYQQVFKGKNLLAILEDSSTYQVMMMLEDGFWRIRHMKRLPDTTKPKQEKGSGVFQVKNKKLYYQDQAFFLKGINYYPQKTPWDMYGDQFDLKQMAIDFGKIKGLGLNTIRIFVPYEDFGKEQVRPEKLDKLEKVLNLAKQKQLFVVVTLFDFYGNYAVLDWTHTHRHAESLLTRFKDHPAILAWDVKNEPDLDFESRGANNVKGWLKTTIAQMRTFAPNHLITVGWSKPEAAIYLEQEVDFVSFHYYKPFAQLAADYKMLNNLIDKPLVLQEFGMSSYSGWFNFWQGGKKAQADYHRKMHDFILQNDLSFMAWTLYDFDAIPRSVVGRWPWRKAYQKHFGFFTTQGKPKPAATYLTY